MFKLNEQLRIQPSILAVSLVSLVVMMGSTMVTPSLTLYAKQDLGANEFLVGAVIAGFAIGRLIFDVPAGFIADRLGLSRTMILGLGILIAASTLAGFASSYWMLLFARMLEGIASSIYVSAAIAFVLLSSDAAKRGTNIGSYQSILMLGPIVGPVVGAPIAEFLGYNAPYFVFAAVVFVATIIISIFSRWRKFHIEKTVQHEHENRKASMAAYLNTAAIATFGFAFLRSGIYTTGMPLFGYGSLNLSVFDIGIILTMASLANLISSFFSGRLTQIYGMQKPLFAAYSNFRSASCNHSIIHINGSPSCYHYFDWDNFRLFWPVHCMGCRADRGEGKENRQNQLQCSTSRTIPCYTRNWI